jgi:hypothetical protein
VLHRESSAWQTYYLYLQGLSTMLACTGVVLAVEELNSMRLVSTALRLDDAMGHRRTRPRPIKKMSGVRHEWA